MTRSTPEARQRLVAAAADMLRRRGLNATSVRELAKHANAPLGSTYHYFPGGKQQVVIEAIEYAGEKIVRSLEKALQAGPVEGLRAFLAMWHAIITKAEFRVGCPVLAVCVEEPASDEDTAALTAAAQVFDAWKSLLAEALHQYGAERKQAKEIATLIIAAIEGALVMCRAKRNAQPLEHVASQLEALVRSAITAK